MTCPLDVSSDLAGQLLGLPITQDEHHDPANIRRWSNVVSMSGQRRRCRSDIDTALGQHHVRDGIYLFIAPPSIFGEMKHTNTIAASTKREANVVLLLGRHRRRWPSIKTLLAQCLVLAGIGSRQLRPKVTAPTTPLLLLRSQA